MPHYLNRMIRLSLLRSLREVSRPPGPDPGTETDRDRIKKASLSSQKGITHLRMRHPLNLSTNGKLVHRAGKERTLMGGIDRGDVVARKEQIGGANSVQFQ